MPTFFYKELEEVAISVKTKRATGQWNAIAELDEVITLTEKGIPTLRPLSIGESIVESKPTANTSDWRSTSR